VSYDEPVVSMVYVPAVGAVHEYARSGAMLPPRPQLAPI
jgi:hypothetical protein